MFNSFGGKKVEIHAGQVNFDGKSLGLPKLSRGQSVEAGDCQIADELVKVI